MSERAGFISLQMEREIEQLRSDNAAQLAELHSISVALGTDEWHSSVTHIEAMKNENAKLKEQLDTALKERLSSELAYALRQEHAKCIRLIRDVAIPALEKAHIIGGQQMVDNALAKLNEVIK